MQILKKKQISKRPRVEGFVERIIPEYTAKEFKTYFRYVVFISISISLLPTIFEFILRLIRPNLNSTKSVAGRKPIAVCTSNLLFTMIILKKIPEYLIISLRFYASGNYLISGGDFSGMSKTRAHRIVLFETGTFDTLILDDGDYPIRSYLMMPLRKIVLRKVYNEFARTCNTIERVFGIWKRRF
ncbi:hypothetical protein ALC53_06661 [Atta colombica]|uniref:DDE Tnp4 domain-containing protein n=1 Tax=Atta colombica TaxID=520822 RepID=A0A195BFG4_9HYME|nr:hypothetical protein ALC53_06661 [Atta colombica]